MHVDAVLCDSASASPPTPRPRVPISSRHVSLAHVPALHTESRTLLRAVSSASMFSFLRCSSTKVRCAAPPLEALAVVGPEGTVGAWRLFILNGKPIALGRKLCWCDVASSSRRRCLVEESRLGRGQDIQSTTMTRLSSTGNEGRGDGGDVEGRKLQGIP